jgi:hypothetical protein
MEDSIATDALSATTRRIGLLSLGGSTAQVGDFGKARVDLFVELFDDIGRRYPPWRMQWT